MISVRKLTVCATKTRVTLRERLHNGELKRWYFEHSTSSRHRLGATVQEPRRRDCGHFDKLSDHASFLPLTGFFEIPNTCITSNDRASLPLGGSRKPFADPSSSSGSGSGPPTGAAAGWRPCLADSPSNETISIREFRKNKAKECRTMRDVSVVTLGRDGMENACVTQLLLIQEITALLESLIRFPECIKTY